MSDERREEEREFIQSKTAWYVATIADRTARLAILRHLRDEHGAFIPDDILQHLERQLHGLIQSFSNYRLSRQQKEVSSKR